MDIDLKSAGIGAGVAVVFGSMVWLGKKIFTKKVVADSTPKWDQMKSMFDMFKHSTKDNLSDNAELMDEIIDSNMPASLIKAAGKEVGIKFTSQCRKDMIKIMFTIGDDDAITAIKKQYESWKNGEFSKEKTSETKENDSEAQTTENKAPESKESEE